MALAFYIIPGIVLLALLLSIFAGSAAYELCERKTGSEGWAGMAAFAGFLVAWPCLSIGLVAAAGATLDFLCVYHEVDPELGSMVEKQTGHCPISYYDWTDWP